MIAKLGVWILVAIGLSIGWTVILLAVERAIRIEHVQAEQETRMWRRGPIR